MKFFFSHKISFPIYIFALIFLSSCATKQESTSSNDPSITVSFILVMPVHINKDSIDPDGKSITQLQTGAQVLRNNLVDFLSEKNTTFLNINDVESLIGDFNGPPKAAARHIARQLNADAVLLTNLNNYSERDGNEHSINQPASVSFQYDLIHVESGRNLCFGVFEETQQALFSNLFSFNKAYKRGFKWVKAETLIKDGLEEKFQQCPQLSQ